MTGQQTLIARVALGLVAAVASVLLADASRLISLPQRRFDRTLYGLFAASRLGLFSLVFLVLRIAPRGDVPAYYFDQALQVLAGRLPYRDFVSSYAPLHPYLGAGLISLWRTPLAIMLFSLLVELLLLPLWMRAGREFLAETELRVAALLYLASPISLQFVAIDGQDNVVIAVLIAFAVLLILRSRWFAAGAVMGFSVAAIKFLPLLYGPAFLVAIPRRLRFVLGGVLVLGAVYGGFLLLQTPILGPLAAERELVSAGDLPYVVEAVFGIALPVRLTDGCLLLCLIALFACIGRAAHRAPIEGRMRVLAFGMGALTLALLAFSKKSWPPYLMLALFPICLSVAGEAASRWRRRLRIAAFAGFSVVAVAEHSYWASLLSQFSSIQFHQALLARRPDAFILLGMELLLVAGYLWLLRESVRRLLPGAGVNA
jgi:hypothetical protein